jgi:hypothetical protein
MPKKTGTPPCGPVSELRRTTSNTVGASLSPDSASSAPRIDGRRGTLRSTENTAAASVGDVIAPSRNDSVQDSPSATCDATAMTATLTATPTVARASPSPMEGRISAHRVVRPPSVKMTTRAAKPSACAVRASSKRTPSTDSPNTIPMPR